MKIWIDITNTPHVNVLIPIIEHLKQDHELIITARDFSETVPLLRSHNVIFSIVDKYKGKSRIRKGYGLINRIWTLKKELPPFDCSFSLGGNYTSSVSRLRNKPSIVFSDNDISFKALAYKYGTHFIFPKYFNAKRAVKKYNLEANNIHYFEGFKEQIYIANYIPDTDFLNKLPFTEFITIRPENLSASYIPKNTKTIVPELFEIFSKENILYLPRYKYERVYAKGRSNIFIPDLPLSGLDVCYYSKAMLTGAGTFAREAAMLGTPAVSFFPGNTFLSVDTILQQKGWEYKSRDPKKIYQYLASSDKRTTSMNESQDVLKEVLSIMDSIISIIGK